MHATMEAHTMGGRVLGVPLPHLAAWRARKLMTQRELASAAAVTQVTIARIERGDRAAFTTVKKLAAGLGVSTDDLLDGPAGSPG